MGARHEIALMIELSANIEKRYRPPVQFHGEFRCSKTLRGKGGQQCARDSQVRR